MPVWRVLFGKAPFEHLESTIRRMVWTLTDLDYSNEIDYTQYYNTETGNPALRVD